MFYRKKPFTKFEALLEYYLIQITIAIILLGGIITGGILFVSTENDNWLFLCLGLFILGVIQLFRKFMTDKGINVDLSRYNDSKLISIVREKRYFTWKYAFLILCEEYNEDDFDYYTDFLNNSTLLIRKIAVWSLRNVRNVELIHILLKRIDFEKNIYVLVWLIEIARNFLDDDAILDKLMELRLKTGSRLIKRKIDNLLNEKSHKLFI